MNELFCSTGTLVGRVCNYDYSLINKYIPVLYEEGLIDGMELMMIPFYYDKIDEILKTVLSCNVPTPIIHCEKEIGVLLSNCDPNSTKRALEMLEINCMVGKKVGAKKMVFHLWGGLESDSHIDYNISILPQIIEMTKKYNLKLLIENIPCTTYSGLENWRKLYKFLPNIEFIFDTRFGAFHDETEEILNEPIWDYINHMHISDYSSFPRDFSKIRPILHPGEGVIDFDFIFSSLKANKYNGSVTLESPVMTPDGADIEKLRATLKYLRKNL